MLYCKCGHRAEDHQYLPGHPDNAQECNGSKKCQCGRFRADPSRIKRPRSRRAVARPEGEGRGDNG